MLAEFKRARDSKRIHKCAAAWLFRKFLSGSALADIKVQLNLSSSDANRHGGTITTYTKVVNYLSRCYATDDMISNTQERNANFKRSSPVPWDLSHKISNLTLRCGGVYKCKTMAFLYYLQLLALYLRLNSRQGNPETCRNSLCYTGISSNHNDNHHLGSTRLGYLAGR